MKHRRFCLRRFSIRTLLLATLLVALGVVVHLNHQKRRNAIALLRLHGFEIEFCSQDKVPYTTRLLANLFGTDAILPVELVGDFTEIHYPGVMDAVAQLNEVKQLELTYQEQESDLSQLRSLTSVVSFVGDNGFVTDDSFLRNMTQLETFVWYEGVFHSDLSVFGELPRLREISIASGSVKISDESFAQLCKCQALEKLSVLYSSNTRGLTDPSPVLNLPNLRELNGILDANIPKHMKIIAQLPSGCIVNSNRP